VFDYRDADVVEKLKGAVQGEWVGAFDAISEGGTIEKSAAVIGKGIVAVTLDPPAELPNSITAKRIFASKLVNAEKELGNFIFREYLPAALKDGHFKSTPPHVVGHGLAINCFEIAFEAQKTASGKKVVVHVGYQ